MIKNRTIKYYCARRAEIIEILAHGGHEPDYVKMLEGARDMASDRIQQLTDLAASGGLILPATDDRRLERILEDVLSRHRPRKVKKV